MNYLVDTCVVSELVRKKPDKNVVGWIDSIDESCLFLSVLTLGEIQKGIARLRDISRQNRIQLWLDRDLRGRFEERILPITDEVALTWGLLQGRLEQGGTAVPSIDGLLAATAIAANLTVATRNTQDIERTGVRLVNPWRL